MNKEEGASDENTDSPRSDSLSLVSWKVDLERVEEALTSRYWRFVFRTPKSCPPDLLTALKGHVPHVPKEEWDERLEWGGCFVNGRRAAENRPLLSPTLLEYYEPKYDFRRVREAFPCVTPEHFLFEDNDLVVLFKPRGLPTLPGREQTYCCVKHDLERHFGRPVHLPSRLDTSTAGLLVVSLTPRMHNALQALFEKRRIEKRYLLDVGRIPEWQSMKVDAPIGKDKRHQVLRRIDVHQGKPAVTIFQYPPDYPDSGSQRHLRWSATVLQAAPITGRTHQIRVHAAALGLPIVGDNFYGGPRRHGETAVDGLRLLSFSLRFRHPLSGNDIALSVPDRHLPSWVTA